MKLVWVAVVAITAAYAVVGWSGVEQWKDSGGDDSFAYRDYVERLYRTHDLPPRSENYEFSLPPGAPYLGVAVTWAFAPILADRTSPPLQGLLRLLRRLLWLALIVGGGALLIGSRRWQPRWLLGVAAWFAAAGWAWVYVNAAVNNERWLPLVLVSYTAAVALVPATALLAHEVWPTRRAAPALGCRCAHADRPDVHALLPPGPTVCAARGARNGDRRTRATHRPHGQRRHHGGRPARSRRADPAIGADRCALTRSCRDVDRTGTSRPLPRRGDLRTARDRRAMVGDPNGALRQPARVELVAARADARSRTCLVLRLAPDAARHPSLRTVVPE